jgi:hypothetical protein
MTGSDPVDDGGGTCLRKRYRTIGALVDTCTAFDALVIVDHGNVLDGYRSHWAGLSTCTAGGAIVLVDDDSHCDSILAESGNAFTY